MKCCWSTSNEGGIGAPSAVLFSGALVFSFFLEAFQTNVPKDYMLRGGLMVTPLVFFLLRTAFVCSRRYEIHNTGITLYYPLGIQKSILWSEFSEIAICKIHYAAHTTQHVEAIRCVIGEEKKGPQHATVGKEWWSRPEYEVIHYRKIISIYKTNDRIAEFHKLCPLPLKDYRFLEDRA